MRKPAVATIGSGWDGALSWQWYADRTGDWPDRPPCTLPGCLCHVVPQPRHRSFLHDHERQRRQATPLAQSSPTDQVGVKRFRTADPRDLREPRQTPFPGEVADRLRQLDPESLAGHAVTRPLLQRSSPGGLGRWLFSGTLIRTADRKLWNEHPCVSHFGDLPK